MDGTALFADGKFFPGNGGDLPQLGTNFPGHQKRGEVYGTAKEYHQKDGKKGGLDQGQYTYQYNSHEQGAADDAGITLKRQVPFQDFPAG